MRFIDFFAGIGGFRIGMEAAGHECIGYSEIDPFCCAVYNRRFGATLNVGDVGKVPVGLLAQLDADVWTGGFPCQPHSVAGRRLGDADPRDLWPVWFDLIRAVRPQLVFAENVPGIATGGRSYFQRILCDLASIGFDVEWGAIRASQFGSHFRGTRLFFVAKGAAPGRGRRERGWVAPSASSAWSGAEFTRLVCDARKHAVSAGARGRVSDGVSGRLDRLGALGNAVVPQVVEWIARRL